MRVLVVDQDSALLTAITQLLGEYFTIDAVTTKADCLDLVRANDYDVIVAGERLEDGSGLELLGQMGRNKPDMLRIFAVDRERLKLLRGRLGPFGLFRTLSYPIEPRQLLAALSAAAGIEEEIEDIDDDPAPAATPAPVAVTVRAVRQPVPTPAPRMRREVHDFTLVDEEPSQPGRPMGQPGRPMGQPGRPMGQPTPQPAPPSRKGSRSRSSARAASAAHRNGRSPRQPTPEALAVGTRLSAAARAKAFPPPLLEPDARRSAFLVGAGVVVIIGAMAIALHVFNTNDTPTFSTAGLSAPSTQDPPEVVKLVADTEAALQKDDYKTARTDITALQQIAPTHPRLPFFVALLAKHDAMQSGRTTGQTNTPSAVARFFARHTSAPPPKPAAPVAKPNDYRPARRPGAAPPALSNSFSGKTLEESNSGATAAVPQVPSVPRAPSAATNSSPAIEEPQIIKRVAAEYPDDAAQKGIEGAVDLSFVISPAGDVREVTVVHAEPSSIFNRAAIAAVRRWKYQPRIVNGVAVESQIQLRMTFKLDGRD